ncbi:MAG: hypothetical protein KDI73_03755 [Candidatus Competibacteraceae bacterium]|nr:hypothetical protein [Candidatus Competibacteraceae bacterium]HRY14520.1 hypothetical protein [Candidatus Competibacteraceae bacterium]
MNALVHNIPLHRLPLGSKEQIIIRTHEPAAIPTALASENPERVVAVQLLSLAADSEPLNAWTPGLPVELVMADPATEFPLLYRHTPLLDQHPVRVVVPVRPGFFNAVKTAVALDFTVRLEVGQPNWELIEELAAVLKFYLHQSTVAQPIEYFQGALLGFYHEEPAPLWAILDEDPQWLRYVADDGAESLHGRLAATGIKALEPEVELDIWIEQVLATRAECRTCEFLHHCGGYFKWPRRDYDCAGVKRLFSELRDAAIELRNDLEAAPIPSE